jgi:hypothetical protein
MLIARRKHGNFSEMDGAAFLILDRHLLEECAGILSAMWLEPPGIPKYSGQIFGKRLAVVGTGGGVRMRTGWRGGMDAVGGRRIRGKRVSSEVDCWGGARC